MTSLPQYYIIKRDESNPLFDKFIKYFIENSGLKNASKYSEYYGYDGNSSCGGYAYWDSIKFFQNNPTLITLEDWASCIKNSQESAQQLEIGKEYEFSYDGNKWVKGTFTGYRNYISNPEYEYTYKYIRPIQIQDEVSKAIELLRKEGFIINKK